METRRETWDSFWAQVLRIDTFEGQWELYRKAADARAEWLEAALHMDRSRPLLSCACGEGGIELALARRGFKVTGIDKCAAFIHFARDQAAKEDLPVTFLVGDLRDKAPLPGGHGTVCCFDTIGLLSTEDEQALATKMRAALTSGGMMILDCPRREDQSSGRTWWKVGEGHVLQETRWDKGSFTVVTDVLHIAADGTRTLLADPYDPGRGDHTGVQRYIYSADELTRLVRGTGLSAELVPHQRKGSIMVTGRPGGEWV